MKTRELQCVNYVCEGNCKLDKKAKFYGLCQNCEFYKAKPGAKPNRKDLRKEKENKIKDKELREAEY